MVDVSLSSFFIISVFTAGIISFFSPCIIPLMPVYVAMLSGSADEVLLLKEQQASKINKIQWRFIFQTLIFVAGLGTTFILLGFSAGLLGGILNSRLFLYIGGGIVIILGIHQTGLLNLVFLERERKVQLVKEQKSGPLGAYLLGIGFSFGWTPCVGPVLASVLVLASNGGHAFYGAFLMLIYTIGLAIPFMLISMFTNVLLRAFKRISRFLPVIRIVGGILIIIMGIVLITNNLNLISQIFLRLQIR